MGSRFYRSAFTQSQLPSQGATTPSSFFEEGLGLWKGQAFSLTQDKKKLIFQEPSGYFKSEVTCAFPHLSWMKTSIGRRLQRVLARNPCRARRRGATHGRREVASTPSLGVVRPWQHMHTLSVPTSRGTHTTMCHSTKLISPRGGKKLG